MFFFFKQKTAYEMRISDWSSDVCSSDLTAAIDDADAAPRQHAPDMAGGIDIGGVGRGGRAAIDCQSLHMSSLRQIFQHQRGGRLGAADHSGDARAGMGARPDQDRKSTRLNSSH